MVNFRTKKPVPAININQMLGSIREADSNQVEAQLEIARLLWVIKKNELYKPTYPSFKDMVQQELDFGVNTALRYVSLYASFKTLKYTKKQFYALMQNAESWRVVQHCLAKAKCQMTSAEMKKFLAKNPRSAPNQINVNLSSELAKRRLYNVLKEHGMIVNNKGQRKNLNVAFESMIDDYTALKKKTKTPRLPGKKRKLAVAG